MNTILPFKPGSSIQLVVDSPCAVRVLLTNPFRSPVFRADLERRIRETFLVFEGSEFVIRSGDMRFPDWQEIRFSFPIKLHEPIRNAERLLKSIRGKLNSIITEAEEFAAGSREEARRRYCGGSTIPC